MKNGTDVYTQVIAKTLREFIGEGREISVERASNITGKAQSSIYAYMDGRMDIPGPALMALMAELPEEFAVKVAACAGFLFQRPPSLNSADPFILNRMFAKSTAVIADALADGRVDHTERPLIMNTVTKQITFLPQWRAAAIREWGI